MRKNLLLLVLVLAGCRSTPLPSGYDSPHVIKDFTGVCLGRDLESVEIHLAKSLEAQWLRLDIPWKSIEMSKGQWDFSRYDAFIEEAHINNLKIIAILDYSNPLYTPNNTHYISPDHYGDYIRYCLKVIEHYKDTVEVFEIWNEPNVHFWKGPKSEFIELQKQTAEAIKRQYPRVTLLNGGLFTAAPGFLKRLFKAGAMENIDGLSFHPYSVTAQGVWRQITKVKKTIRNQESSLPLWITEIGYPSRGLYPSRTPEEKLPEKMIKLICYSAAEGVDHLFWYKLHGGPVTRPWDSEQSFYLVDDKQRRTPGALTFQRLGAVINGSTLRNDLLDPPLAVRSDIEAFVFQKEDDLFLIIWSRRGTVEISLGERTLNLTPSPVIVKLNGDRRMSGSPRLLFKHKNP